MNAIFGFDGEKLRKNQRLGHLSNERTSNTSLSIVKFSFSMLVYMNIFSNTNLTQNESELGFDGEKLRNEGLRSLHSSESTPIFNGSMKKDLMKLAC